MEQKRVLWIIAAVGVFLLVVLGAALILYSPTTKANETLAYTNKDSSNGWISLSPSTPSLAKTNVSPSLPNEQKDGAVAEIDSSVSVDDDKNEKAKIDNLTLYAGNATIYSENTKIDGKIPEFQVQPVSPVVNMTIDVTSDAIQAKKAEVAKTDAIKAEKLTEVSEKPTKKASQTVTKKTQAKPATKPSATATAKKATEKTQFWVQVTALTSRKNADSVRETLGENKITADVFTYTDARGRLFYRVRVGPYTTKSEAEYWQAKITNIADFKNNQSYVAATKVAMN